MPDADDDPSESGAAEVRDLGVVEGREVYPGDPDHPTRPGPGAGRPGADPGEGPGAGQDDARTERQAAAFAQWLGRVRAARQGIPNSRPLPAWVARLAWMLDSVFEVPFTRRRVGVDGLLTFVPVVGDVAGLTLSMAVVAAGIASGVSIPTVVRMMLNVGLETLIGIVPFAGAVFDMAYKANERNVLLIEADFADRRSTRRSSIKVLLVTLGALVVAILLAVLAFVVTLAITVWLVRRLLGR